MKDYRLGDTMPINHHPKWGDMRAGKGEMSNEWHEMDPATPKMSEKWDHMEPSKGRMSEKWVEMENPSNSMGGNEWDVMKQESRMDPYSMNPSKGDDTKTPFKPMSKGKPDNKVSRPTQHNEFGSTREI